MGEPIESAASYNIELAFIDIVSNQTLLKASKPIETDILVEKSTRGNKIRIRDILFDKHTHHLAGDAFIILDRLTYMLKKFPKYKIDIHGHSGHAYEKDDYQLSRKRADAVKAYLLSRGVHGSRMNIESKGSAYPVVLDIEMKKEYLNQRVDFILRKK